MEMFIGDMFIKQNVKIIIVPQHKQSLNKKWLGLIVDQGVNVIGNVMVKFCCKDIIQLTDFNNEFGSVLFFYKRPKYLYVGLNMQGMSGREGCCFLN